ncbi:hypothetical protein E8E13_001077 [Curvularia kusanoi]|uniref:Uncharacterized protein n=1 Tax=Curvularia kusanoi TaxID=90978 RepID=A0A9P4W5M1_CURKU|nr:hypothetical protein E8E13_001077 [Curvularia kusanoi]
MNNHHCPAANTHTTSSHGDYFSYCQLCLQHHLPIPRQLSGIELQAEPTRLAYLARYPGQHVYQPSPPTSHRPAGYSPQNNFDEAAYQLNSLPGHYGPAFAFEVEAEPRTPGSEALIEILMQATVDNAAPEPDSQELGTPERDNQQDSSRSSGFQQEFCYLKDLIAKGLPTPPPTPPQDGDHVVGEVSTHAVAVEQEDLGYLPEHIIAGDAALRTLRHGAAPVTNTTRPATPAAITQQSSTTVPAITVTPSSAPNPIRNQHSTQVPSPSSPSPASGAPQSAPMQGAWQFNYGEYAEEGYGTWEDDVRAAREALATRPLGTNGNAVLRVRNPMVPWWAVLETIGEEEENDDDDEEE